MSLILKCTIVIFTLKGVVQFFLKNVADNLLTTMSSKISMSFFLQSKINEGF